jgi:chromosome segregation ATPase
MNIKVLSLLLTLLLANSSQAADDAKIRETIRALSLRLRSAETERNNLLTEKAQLEQEKKTITEKSDALIKQAAIDKETIATLTTKTEEQEAALAQAKEALEKWKSAYEQTAASAQKEKAEQEKLAGEALLLKRRLADREAKNRELYKLSNEILARYEKFGLGDALAAREPFTGIMRVKLENLVQDYSDKIADQRIKP